MSGRQELIDKVSAAVLQDRNKSYGDPESNFKNIADVWNWWFGGKASFVAPFTPLDVAHMMTLMKMARLKFNPTHFDSQVDAAGYQACAADFVAGAKIPTLHAGELMLRLADGGQIILREGGARDMLAVIDGRDKSFTKIQYLGKDVRSYRTHGSEWHQL